MLPCILTTNTNNNTQDAEFVFQQLWKVFSLRLWFMVTLMNNMDHGLRALSSEWSLAHWGQTMHIQLKPCIFPLKNWVFPPLFPINSNPSLRTFSFSWKNGVHRPHLLFSCLFWDFGWLHCCATESITPFSVDSLITSCAMRESILWTGNQMQGRNL